MLARAAGAELADLEFVQFHPTAVVGVKGREGFLVTEAIRGEGATLHDAAGERFVDELEPRDAVAKAIHKLLVETGAPAVYLDMTAIDPARFPNVVDALREAGVDPATERIPVSPASHYVMGGITTDLDGRSTVAGLYAVGEAACTGLHGANRLASNSLSECFVFGRRAALAGLDDPAATTLARPAGGGPGPGAEPRDTPRDVARGRAGADRRGPAPAARGPASAGAARRRVGARPRGEPRRPRPRRVPGPGPRARPPPQRPAGVERDAVARLVDMSVPELI